MEEKIMQLREKVINELGNIESGMHVKLNYDPMILEMLLFDKKIDKTYMQVYQWKVFALPSEILEKIDFDNVIFDEFRACGFNFTNLYNVKINPQKVYLRDLNGATLNGVTFTGSFDDVLISGADFTGSKNALINPKKLNCKDGSIYMNECNFKDVTFTDHFEICRGVEHINVSGSNFDGSKNAILEVKKGIIIKDAKLKDAVIVGDLKNIIVRGVDFTGARKHSMFKDSKPIELDTNYNDLTDTVLNGVILKGNCIGAVINNTDFTGSINGYVDLRLISETSDYKTCNFTDAKVSGMVNEPQSMDNTGL